MQRSLSKISSSSAASQAVQGPKLGNGGSGTSARTDCGVVAYYITGVIADNEFADMSTDLSQYIFNNNANTSYLFTKTENAG